MLEKKEEGGLSEYIINSDIENGFIFCLEWSNISIFLLTYKTK